MSRGSNIQIMEAVKRKKNHIKKKKSDQMGGNAKIRSVFLKVPIMRVIIFWCLYGGSLSMETSYLGTTLWCIELRGLAGMLPNTS